MEHTIDATEKKLGRVASEAAVLLMGKNTPDFAKNQVANVKVNITNASKMDVNDKKMDTKIYKRYSGYPGGLKETKMSAVVTKKGYGEVLKMAIFGMLPSNKLRPKMIKNLKIYEGGATS